MLPQSPLTAQNTTTIPNSTQTRTSVKSPLRLVAFAISRRFGNSCKPLHNKALQQQAANWLRLDVLWGGVSILRNSTENASILYCVNLGGQGATSLTDWAPDPLISGAVLDFPLAYQRPQDLGFHPRSYMPPAWY
jgi:hypothetical protein